MRMYEIDSHRLFKALEIARQRRIDKLKKKAIRKQKWINFKRRFGLWDIGHRIQIEQCVKC